MSYVGSEEMTMRPSYIPTEGSWIKSKYSDCICQVQRVITDVFRPRFHLQDRKKENRDGMVLAKRLVDRKWRLTIDNEQLSLFLVEPLSPEEMMRVERFLEENPAAAESFRAFRKEYGILLNVTVNFPDHVASEEVETVFAGLAEKGLTSDEIIGLIESSPLGIKVEPGIHRATLQFYCRDCEVRAQEYVYRSLRVLPF